VCTLVRGPGAQCNAGPASASIALHYGYVFAQDNFCILARDVLVATGTQARWFGACSGNSNLIADWTYAMVNSDARVNPTWGSLDQDTRHLAQGYADGYNRYLREKGANAGAAECRGAVWTACPARASAGSGCRTCCSPTATTAPTSCAPTS
jgi:hypothetical protein